MAPTLTRRALLRAGIAVAATGAMGAAAGCGPVARRSPDVVVIGAGLSGLYAARLLEAQGVSVRVLEAAPRIGGRMYTLDGVEGAPETGGAQIGGNYARVLTTMSELGLDSRGPRSSSYGQAFSLGGELISADEWAEHPSNPLRGDERARLPWQQLTARAAAANPLRDFDDWSGDAAQSHDVSYLEFMRAQGASDEAIRMAGVAPNVNDLSTASMLGLWRSLVLFADARRSPQPLHFVAGGSQRLPEAMAASLSAEVETGRRAVALASDARGAEVRLADGERVRAPRVICTLPFTVLRELELDLPLAEAQAEAVRELPYTQILHLHFRPRERFWEDDGWPPAMWTDGPLQRLFMSDDDSGRPSGHYQAWIDGTPAGRLGERDDTELAELAARELRRLRPASGGRLDLVHVQRWIRTNPLSGGAYMHWAPGMIARFAGRMHAPAGRVHFAGEHLGQLFTGMEAAMESGERAALEILDLAAA